MYTTEQIRAAGTQGEINSIDVEHLIDILKRENKVSGEDALWNEVGAILNDRAVSFTMYPKYMNILKSKFSIIRK